MCTEQRQAQGSIIAPCKALAGQRVRYRADGIKIRLDEPRVVLAAGLLENLFDLRNIAVAHNVAIGLDYSGLSRSNLGQRVPEILGVLKADCRYHGALRTVDGIRAVKRTAETDLKHNDVALLLKKIEHRYRGDKLELAWVIRHAFGYRLHALRKLREPVVRNLDAVYLHPLIEAADIRRGVERRFISGLLHDGREHRAGRAFTVRPRDVDEAQLFLRVAEL